MKADQLYRRLQEGHRSNVAFEDLLRLARAFGFQLVRTKGSHHALAHERLSRPLIVQPDRNGEAKPYQLRQLLEHIERYNLTWTRDSS